MLWRLLKWGLFAVLGILALVVCAVLVVWLRPGLVVNTAVLKRILPKIPQAKGATWEAIALSAESPSFFRKTVHLSAQGLCWESRPAAYRGCFRSVDIHAEVDFSRIDPRFRVGPISLSGGDVAIRLLPALEAPKEKKAPAREGPIVPQLPDFLRRVALEKSRIEIDRVAVTGATFEATGNVVLEAVPDDQSALWRLQAKARLRQQGKTYDSDADVNLDSLQSPWFGPYIGRAKVSGKLPGGQSFAASLRASPTGVRRVQFAAQASYRRRAKRADLSVSGQAGPEGVSGSLTAEGQGWIPQVPRVAARHCPFRYEKKAGATRASFECGIAVEPKFPTLDAKYAAVLKTSPLKLKAAATLSADSRNPVIDGHAEVVVDPLLAKVPHGHGSVGVEFKGPWLGFPRDLDVSSRVSLQVSEFQEVVQALEGLPWAVPNPFRTLRGAIDLEASSRGTLGIGTARLPIRLKTRLASPHQKLSLDGEGELQWTGPTETSDALPPHLEFQLKLSDVRLMLPYMAMAAPPRLTPDSRIRVPAELTETPEQRAKPTPHEKPAFTYHIEVTTPPESPVRLISNLAKSEIPLIVTLHLVTGSSATGSIRVSDFDVELFRRKATLQHFFVRLTPNPDDIEVNGEVRVVYADYTVKILILGQAKAPEVKFTSQPPLPEKDVIAVLLFGKKIDALDSSQAQSVGSTNAAVADSAISLASMYLLAATPVESVGYDPSTGVFNAKVRLADGTSLNVGSDLSHLNQLGLRKRLGGDFYLNTYLSNPLHGSRKDDFVVPFG